MMLELPTREHDRSGWRVCRARAGLREQHAAAQVGLAQLRNWVELHRGMFCQQTGFPPGYRYYSTGAGGIYQRGSHARRDIDHNTCRADADHAPASTFDTGRMRP